MGVLRAVERCARVQGARFESVRNVLECAYVHNHDTHQTISESTTCALLCRVVVNTSE